MAGRGKLGRPSKGPRKGYELLVPVQLAKALEADAKQRGQTYTDWLVHAVADKLGVELPGQQELPLADASR